MDSLRVDGLQNKAPVCQDFAMRTGRPSSEQPFPDDRHAAEYIHEHALALTKLAQQERLPMLAYLLEMAVAEADEMARQPPLAKERSKAQRRPMKRERMPPRSGSGLLQP
jgi:hypothetical protein